LGQFLLKKQTSREDKETKRMGCWKAKKLYDMKQKDITGGNKKQSQSQNWKKIILQGG